MGRINKSEIKIHQLNINYIRKKSFTLIEMMVVITTISLILPVIFAIIFSILKQQIKIQQLSNVKREGDYILNIIENIVKNHGESIHSNIPPTENNKICQSSSLENVSYFKDRYNNWFRFYLDNNNSISSESSIIGRVYLNSSKTRITNFNIQCYKTGAYSPPIIIISFTIKYNMQDSQPEEQVAINYKTKLKLKNY